jgi:MSHA biogenesis protein MshQ
MVAENNDDGVDRSARLSVPGSAWVAGAFDVNTVAASFSRAAAPDGPYDLLQLGVQVSDPDLALLAGRDMNPGTTGACAGACTAKALSGFARMRFGRLRMFNVSGTSRLGLPLRVQTQYYTPTGFVTNGDDDCTVINGSDFAMAFLGTTNLAACETAVSPSAAVAFSAGQATGLQLAAPGIGNDGSVDLRLNLGAGSGTTCTAVGASTSAATSSSLDYLRGNWGGAAAWDQDPTARATFGVYRNAAEFLYLQENY